MPTRYAAAMSIQPTLPSGAVNTPFATLARALRHPPVWLRRAAALGALALTFGVLWQGAQPHAASLLREGWDKVAHASLHFTLCWLCLLAMGLRRGPWAVVLCVAFAGLDEFAQQFSPGRSVSAADVLASAVGALVALASAHAAAWFGEMRQLRQAQAQRKRLAVWIKPPP